MMFNTKIKFQATLFIALLAILTTFGLSMAQTENESEVETTTTDGPKCPQVSGKLRYSMESARPGLNGIFLHNFDGGSEHLRLKFVKDKSHFDVNTNGHIIIRGILVPAEGEEHLTLGYESFKFIFKLKLKQDAQDYVPYTQYLTITPQTLASWKYYDILEGSKMIGVKNGVEQSFDFYPMTREDGNPGQFALQVGNQAALIGDGAQQGVFGASTWFDYKRFDGKIYKADINVLLDLVCSTIKPLAFEGVCSEKIGQHKWKLTNHNDLAVLLKYTNAAGEAVYLKVPRKNNNTPGVLEFYTPIEEGDQLTLVYAAFNGEGTPEAITATAKTEGCGPICDDKTVSFAASSFSSNGHSIWLSQFVTGKNENLHFAQGAILTYSKDGSKAYLTGNISNNLLGQNGWKATFIFDKAADSVEPKFELGNQTNENGQNQQDLAQDWKYFNFVSGVITNGTEKIELCRMNNNYGFQIGESANGKNFKLGASTWFVWKYNGQSAQGDINIDLKELCQDTECKEVKIVSCRPYCGGFLLSLKSEVKYDTYKYVVVDPKTGKQIAEGTKTFCNGYGFAWFPRNGVKQGQTLILKLYSKCKKIEYCPVRFVFNND